MIPRHPKSEPTAETGKLGIHGRAINYRCHSGLKVYATDMIEAHDITSHVISKPRVSIALFLEGSVDISIDGNQIHLGNVESPSGAIWVIARPAEFKRTTRKGAHVRKVIISVPPEWITGMLTDDADIERLQAFLQTHGASTKWTPSKRSAALAAQILNPTDCPQVIQQMSVESQAIEIVADAVSATLGSAVPEPPRRAYVLSLTRASRIRAYLLENINDDMSLESVAKDVGISVASMQRDFKNAYGQTVVDFVRECRLHAARQAMDKEGISVSEAAYRAGYSSPANFSTAFKRLFGLTPSQAKS